MSEVSEAPVAVEPEQKKKSEIIHFFSAPAIAMIKEAPNNPMVRSFILSKVGVMPPEERDSYIKIKNWIESNVESPQSKMAANTRVGNATAFEIDVDLSETYYGSADWSEDYSVTGVFPMLVSDIDSVIELVIQNSSSFRDMVSLINDKVRPNRGRIDTGNRSPSDDGKSYDNHETSGSHGLSVDFSTGEVKEKITAWLRANRPEIAARFQLPAP